MAARKGGPNPRLGTRTGHANKKVTTPPEPTGIGPRSMPARRNGGEWSPIVVEWWESASKSVAAQTVWDEWGWLQLEVTCYHFQIWWDCVEAGKDGEAIRSYAELRQEAAQLYLPAPDRIRGQREGSIGQTPTKPVPARKQAASRARLQAVE